ncbi:hypothetical protein C8R44DRAFT_860219 [Mycena epipterygia]|nr:hypothetical protein C8R44DRAFT_860219 [Mycena epipterygia]
MGDGPLGGRGMGMGVSAESARRDFEIGELLPDTYRTNRRSRSSDLERGARNEWAAMYVPSFHLSACTPPSPLVPTYTFSTSISLSSTSVLPPVPFDRASCISEIDLLTQYHEPAPTRTNRINTASGRDVFTAGLAALPRNGCYQSIGAFASSCTEVLHGKIILVTICFRHWLCVHGPRRAFPAGPRRENHAFSTLPLPAALRAFDGSERLIRANSAAAAPHAPSLEDPRRPRGRRAHPLPRLSLCLSAHPPRWRVHSYVPSYTPVHSGRDANFASPVLIRPVVFAPEPQSSDSPDARSSISAREALGSANRRMAKTAVEWDGGGTRRFIRGGGKRGKLQPRRDITATFVDGGLVTRGSGCTGHGSETHGGNDSARTASGLASPGSRIPASPWLSGVIWINVNPSEDALRGVLGRGRSSPAGAADARRWVPLDLSS